jgi:teichuronic acid exporter
MLSFLPVQKLRLFASSRYIRNIGWLGASELINRIFRLATTVTLIRLFSKADYGMLSAIYTVFEFGLTFSMGEGIGSMILQAQEEEVDEIATNVYWLNWILMGSIFLLQCVLAYPIALFYKNPDLAWPIAGLGLCYLVIPIYSVQESMLARKNRLEVKSWAMTAQAIAANVMIVGFVLLGFGIWSIVASMVLSYPLWIVLMFRHEAWRPKRFTIDRWREITGFGSRVLGVELLNRLRMNVDYLIVAGLLGTDALGLYFFAFNAGFGISQSILWSIGGAWYPEFCEARSSLSALRLKWGKTLKTIGFVIVPLVLLQTTFAHWYIPILAKGDKWNDAIPIVMIICLSAIPLAVSRSTSQLLRAMDQVKLDLIWNVIFVGIFSASIAIAVVIAKGFVPMGSYQIPLLVVALTVLVNQCLLVPGFAGFVDRKFFRGLCAGLR